MKTGIPEIDTDLLEMPLEVLTDEELSSIVEIGETTGQKLYPFKTGEAELPRVRQVLGFLHGIEFETLLDVERQVRETDASDTMEGLYIKIEENGQVIDRLKYVRASFTQSVLIQ